METTEELLKNLRTPKARSVRLANSERRHNTIKK